MNAWARSIYEEVKANYEKLNECTLHDFSIDKDPDKKLGKRWECVNCSGQVGHSEKVWYEYGLKHARKTF